MPNSGLSNCIKDRLENYFNNLKGGAPKNIYDKLLREFDRPLIEVVLKYTKGNKVKTADILGINRNTLSKKMKELDIKASDYK